MRPIAWWSARRARWTKGASSPTPSGFSDRRWLPDAADPVPGLFVGGVVSERRRLEQAHLVFLLPAPGGLDDDVWALRVFVEILGGGMSSRLFQEARERLGLAYAIDAYSDTYADVGVLGVYAGCAAQDAGRLAEVTAQQIRALTARRPRQ